MYLIQIHHTRKRYMLKPRQRQTIESMKKLLKDRELILYGRGSGISNLIKEFDVKYIVDKDDERWDTCVDGVRIFSPDHLYRESPDKIVILVTAGFQYVQDITNTILNIDDFDIFYWDVLNSMFLCDISTQLYDNYERIRAIESRLYDDRSRKILREVVHRRMIGCKSGYEDLKTCNEVQYLYPPLFGKEEGVILDCGGYIGDSVDRFVGYFGNKVEKIYTFEALPANIEMLEKKKVELTGRWDGNLKVIPFAVSNKKTVISFCETSKKGGSFSPEFRSHTQYKYQEPINTFDVTTCTIDEVILFQEKVRLIKMDIEGAEYEALLGAKKTIKTNKPGLAISIYHNAMDYYRIAELILSFVPEYNISIRHHKTRHVDTVLYAWVGR